MSQIVWPNLCENELKYLAITKIRQHTKIGKSGYPSIANPKIPKLPSYLSIQLKIGVTPSIWGPQRYVSMPKFLGPKGSQAFLL